jgi:three-Cys-motif partner protein
MVTVDGIPFDEIGCWSEVKLDIVKEYAAAYSRILNARQSPSFEHVYIDGFAGTGTHFSKTTRDFVPGSPLNALLVVPPFRRYYFIDILEAKTKALEELAGQRQDVTVFQGDCNAILLQQVFPQVRYERYQRGLCLLDPYGLHLDWQVVQAAGMAKSLEIFLNFPVADINRNVLWRNPERVDANQARRMTRFWGDESWRSIAYHSQPGLFGDMEEKESNDVVAEAFRKRLKGEAGFAYVPQPMPMRNSKGGVVYYLFFASQKPVAEKIVADIFRKHRDCGAA